MWPALPVIKGGMMTDENEIYNIDGISMWSAWSEPGAPVCIADSSENEEAISVNVYPDANGVIQGVVVWADGVVAAVIGDLHGDVVADLIDHTWNKGVDAAADVIASAAAEDIDGIWAAYNDDYYYGDDDSTIPF